MKDSSSARSFANEQKREGGCTDVGKSRKREGGGGGRMWQQPNWRPSLQLASVSASLSINNWGNPVAAEEITARWTRHDVVEIFARLLLPLRHRLLLILAAADENSSTGALPSPFSFTAENVCPTLLQFLFSPETPKLSAIDTVSRSSPRENRDVGVVVAVGYRETSRSPRKRLELRARLVEIKYRGRERGGC